MKILLLDNYDSFTYNLLHAVKELGATDIKHHTDTACPRNVLFPQQEMSRQDGEHRTEGRDRRTATNTLKPATVESGATVRVPLFISEGETIEIDTRDGSYVGRVKA